MLDREAKQRGIGENRRDVLEDKPGFGKSGTSRTAARRISNEFMRCEPLLLLLLVLLLSLDGGQEREHE